MSKHRHRGEHSEEFDEGTALLDEIAEDVEHEREAGASRFAVPEDEPAEVDEVPPAQAAPEGGEVYGHVSPTRPPIA